MFPSSERGNSVPCLRKEETLCQYQLISLSPPPLVRKKGKSRGGDSTFWRKTQLFANFFNIFSEAARRRRNIFRILCDVMMGNTVVIDHFETIFGHNWPKYAKFSACGGPFSKMLSSPPLVRKSGKSRGRTQRYQLIRDIWISGANLEGGGIQWNSTDSATESLETVEA